MNAREDTEEQLRRRLTEILDGSPVIKLEKELRYFPTNMEPADRDYLKGAGFSVESTGTSLVTPAAYRTMLQTLAEPFLPSSHETLSWVSMSTKCMGLDGRSMSDQFDSIVLNHPALEPISVEDLVRLCGCPDDALNAIGCRVDRAMCDAVKALTALPRDQGGLLANYHQRYGVVNSSIVVASKYYLSRNDERIYGYSRNLLVHIIGQLLHVSFYAPPGIRAKFDLSEIVPVKGRNVFWDHIRVDPHEDILIGVVDVSSFTSSYIQMWTKVINLILYLEDLGEHRYIVRLNKIFVTVNPTLVLKLFLRFNLGVTLELPDYTLVTCRGGMLGVPGINTWAVGCYAATLKSLLNSFVGQVSSSLLRVGGDDHGLVMSGKRERLLELWGVWCEFCASYIGSPKDPEYTIVNGTSSGLTATELQFCQKRLFYSRSNWTFSLFSEYRVPLPGSLFGPIGHDPAADMDGLIRMLKEQVPWEADDRERWISDLLYLYQEVTDPNTPFDSTLTNSYYVAEMRLVIVSEGVWVSPLVEDELAEIPSHVGETPFVTLTIWDRLNLLRSAAGHKTIRLDSKGEQIAIVKTAELGNFVYIDRIIERLMTHPPTTFILELLPLIELIRKVLGTNK